MEILNNISGVPAPVGPYSQGARLGDLVFCSGQIGIEPASGKMRDGLEAQTEQVLKNLAALLEGAGSSPRKILMTTIFLADISSGKTVNELYSKFVDPVNPPARQTVAVKDLPLGALVEISVIACR